MQTCKEYAFTAGMALLGAAFLYWIGTAPANTHDRNAEMRYAGDNGRSAVWCNAYGHCVHRPRDQ